jgi:hypothetical protein
VEPIKSIGNKLSGGEQRDCIHVAIMPAVSDDDHDLRPGEPVRLLTSNTSLVRSAHGDEAVGVVDPFLFSGVRKGERFWLFLKPGTITGLRHDWTHPAIDGYRPPVSESEQWLREFADKWNFDYDAMITGAREHGCGYVVARGIDLHSASELDPGDETAFWEHLENLTGRQYGSDHRRNFSWSCTC